jgi:hypothetical protein
VYGDESSALNRRENLRKYTLIRIAPFLSLVFFPFFWAWVLYTADNETMHRFVKRDKYANAGKGHQSDYYTRSKQLEVCEETKRAKKGVCSKEIRFLGHTGQLLSSASQRGIPFTLIYQMRDPR